MNLSRKSKLSIFAVVILAVGLYAGVFVSQQNQETRSRAAGCSSFGNVSENNCRINGNFIGNLFGDNNTITGSMYGNIDNANASGNLIMKDMLGNIVGNGNEVCGKMTGNISGNNNIIHGTFFGNNAGRGNILNAKGECGIIRLSPTTAATPTIRPTTAPTVRPTTAPTIRPTIAPTIAAGRCNDNRDNDNNGFTDKDDSSCHTDGNPNNPNSYNPNRNGERSGGGTCSDSIDNNNNGLIDGADPLCHTDSDVNNPNSYDPRRNEGGASISPTVTQAPTQTPTQRPTVVPTLVVDPTVSLSGTKLSFNLLLHGIGKAGDNANPQGLGNQNPLRPQRIIEVIVSDSQNQVVQTKSGSVTYDTNSGSFKGVVGLDSTVSTGSYTVKAKTNQFLRALVPGIQTITQGTTNQLPATALINGDINGDNAINIVDYNILIGCYSDLSPAISCTSANKLVADLDDDGSVNQFDYNLFLRELVNLPGQ